MTANERLEALRVIERHLTMNRQERRQAGICTPRRIIEAARDELLPHDPSWDEVATKAGVDAPTLAPGDVLPDELATAQLYWPNVNPEPFRMSTTEALPRRNDVPNV